MKFYSKLALHFLNNEIYVLKKAYSTSNQSDLNAFMFKPTSELDMGMIELLRYGKESNDLIHDNLCDLIKIFKLANVTALITYGSLPVCNVDKMALLIKMIEAECTKASLWNVEYDDSDPSCIFQYRMLSCIIEDKASGINALSNDTLQLIEKEFKKIQEWYFALSSKSAKIDFIRSCLKNISNQQFLSTKDYSIPMMSFFGVSTPIKAKSSEIQRTIELIYEEVDQLNPVQQTGLSIKEESLATSSLRI